MNVEEPLTSSDDDNVVALDTFKLEETVTLERVDKPVTLSVEESVVAPFTLSVEERVDELITFRLFKEVSPVVLRLLREEYPVTLNELSIVVSLLPVRVPLIIVLPELSIVKASVNPLEDSLINGWNFIPEYGALVVPVPASGYIPIPLDASPIIVLADVVAVSPDDVTVPPAFNVTLLAEITPVTSITSVVALVPVIIILLSSIRINSGPLFRILIILS